MGTEIVLHRRQTLAEIEACFAQGLGVECDITKLDGRWRLAREEAVTAASPALEEVLSLWSRERMLVLDFKSAYEDVHPPHPMLWTIQSMPGPARPQSTCPQRTKQQLLRYALLKWPLSGAHILPAETDRFPKRIKLYETLRHPGLVSIPYITSNGYAPAQIFADSPYVLVHENFPDLALALAHR
jgi:hypothetical protein